MAETCIMSAELIMEFSGGSGVIPCTENEYIGMEIPPADELREIESSINEARGSGVDLLPALFLLETCRSLFEEGRTEDYENIADILSGICRSLPAERGGRLKPVGDYLGFFVE